MSITLYESQEIVEGVVVDSQVKLDSAINGLMAKLSPLTRNKYGQTIREYLEFAANYRGSHISETFSSYLGSLLDKGLSESTVNGKRVAIRRFYEWGARVGYVSDRDYLRIKEIESITSSGSKRGSWLTEDQMKCVLSGPDTSTPIGRRDKAVLAILIGCGMRRTEMTKLKWSQLVLQGNTWIFENVGRKHHRTQPAIPVPSFVKKALDEYMSERKGNDYILISYDRHGHSRDQMTSQSIYLITKRYTEMCGLGGIACHDLRRSFSRRAVEQGLELSQLQLMLGHSNIATTQKYVNEIMDVDTIANAAEIDIE